VQFTSEQRISKVVTGVNMVAAIVSLVAAVLVLTKANDYKTEKSVKVSKQELVWLTRFIVRFALWVGFMTRLPRKDVFGAIAVYAAVLVVFVGTGG
jgi:cytochrome bd-type quinol oxidase subunit 2